MEPNSFSFNSPVGACVACNGLGTRTAVDLEKLLRPELSIADGAIAVWGELGDEERQAWHVGYRRDLLQGLHIDLETPGSGCPKGSAIWCSTAPASASRWAWATQRTKGTFNSRFDGVVPWLERAMRESDSDWKRDRFAPYFASSLCTDCGGCRINPLSAAVRVGGRSLPDFCRMTTAEAARFLTELQLGSAHAQIASGVLKEVRSRLRFLVDVGLDYLTLDRSGPTLSGGEAQRIRLASQIGSELTGVLYVLDEPSIGLHQRDNGRLISTMRHLRDIGNSVIVVEHDEETIRAADHVVDFGPAAGNLGGAVVYSGSVAGVLTAPGSITGDYLSGRKRIPVPARRRQVAAPAWKCAAPAPTICAT